MKKIPIKAAKAIAVDYDYQQVIVLGRNVWAGGGEHITTYGVNKEHCRAAGLLSQALQRFMDWMPGIDLGGSESCSCGKKKRAYHTECDECHFHGGWDPGR